MSNPKNKDEPQGSASSRRTTIGSAARWAIGAKYFNPKSWVVSAGYERGSVVKKAWSNLRANWHIKTKDECRKESFADSVARQRLSPAMLDAKKAELCRGSRICYGSAVAILIFCLYNAASGNVLGGIGGLAMFAVCVQCGLLRAYRAWQIDTRALGPFTQFLRTAEAWFI